MGSVNRATTTASINNTMAISGCSTNNLIVSAVVRGVVRPSMVFSNYQQKRSLKPAIATINALLCYLCFPKFIPLNIIMKL